MNDVIPPQELMARLNEREDAESALTIIADAQNLVQRYEQAIDYARRFLAQDLLASGESSRKTEAGSYSWRSELDEDAWEQALDSDPTLAQHVDTLESAIDAGSKAQKMLTRLQQPHKRAIPGRTLYVRTG